MLNNHHSTKFLDPNLMIALSLPPRTLYSRYGNEKSKSVERFKMELCSYQFHVYLCIIFGSIGVFSYI
jgi:hypothetical protein